MNTKFAPALAPLPSPRILLERLRKFRQARTRQPAHTRQRPAGSARARCPWSTPAACARTASRTSRTPSTGTSC